MSAARVRVDLTLMLDGRAREVRFDSDAEHTAILGPSGCGKSTLLRAIAGFHPDARGLVEIGGRRFQDGARSLIAPEARGIGWAPQEALLFPHLSVRENIVFGAGDTSALSALCAALEIEPLLGRTTAQLSGGERQRVSIARALMRAPTLLLLDEPLSALDQAARVRVAEALVAERARLGAMSLVVSHDRGDVSRLAERHADIRW